MAISFPASPTVGQQSTQNGRTYAWSGSAWEFAPEGVYAIGNSGNAITLSLANGTFQTCTLNPTALVGPVFYPSCTFTMPALAAGKRFTLVLKSPSSGAKAGAIFTGVRWKGGNQPAQTVGIGGLGPVYSYYDAFDVYTFTSDGTYWYGDVAQDYRSDTSSATKPILDGYYETGTWTPSYTAPTQPLLNYTADTAGTWTRIGQLVHATGRIRVNSKTGGSGILRVVGLPFQIAGGTQNYGCVNIGFRDGWVTYAPTCGYLEPSTYGFVLLNFPAGAAAQVGIAVAYMLAPSTGGSDIMFTVTYHKA
jgi:hypothetical protein